MKKQTPFWFFTTAIFIGTILPTLVQDGMFMDGASYICVSKNMANGIGSFWKPIFTSTWNHGGNPAFLEHPPLVYGIQSFFFKFLGNSIYVERFYSFLTACITAFLIHKTWILLNFKEKELQKLSWLPILLWIIIPVCFWSYQNNVHENTLGIFALLAVYFSLKALFKKEKILIYFVLSGVFIFFASFSKGVPGLFPIGVIGLFWMICKKISFGQMIQYTGILILTPITIYFLLTFIPEAYASLSFYVEERLLHRIDANPTVDSRFYILQRLFEEMIPMFAFVLVFLGIFKAKKIKQNLKKNYVRKAIMLIFIGGSASIPLMLTLVQRGFYFIPALPYFALGFGLFIAPGLSILIDRIDIKKDWFKGLKIVSISLCIGAILFSVLQIGKTSRDHHILHDTYLIGETIPAHSTISVDYPILSQWAAQVYFIRHFNISFDSPESQKEFYLIEKEVKNLPSKNYVKIDIETKKYDLYKLK